MLQQIIEGVGQTTKIQEWLRNFPNDPILQIPLIDLDEPDTVELLSRMLSKHDIEKDMALTQGNFDPSPDFGPYCSITPYCRAHITKWRAALDKGNYGICPGITVFDPIFVKPNTTEYRLLAPSADIMYKREGQPTGYWQRNIISPIVVAKLTQNGNTTFLYQMNRDQSKEQLPGIAFRIYATPLNITFNSCDNSYQFSVSF